MDFVGKRSWFFLISLLVIAPGVFFLIIAPGLRPGIDFTGGSTLTINFSAPIEQTDLRQNLATFGHPDAIVQKMGGNTFFIRTKELQQEDKNQLVASLERALDELPKGIELLSASEFATGTLMTIEFAREVPQALLRDELRALGYPDATVGGIEGNSYLIRTVALGEETRIGLVEQLGQTLSPPVHVLAFDLVSPVVARETVFAAFWAVVMAAVGIFLYLWWAFRNVPSPFRYGAAAIVALLHDSMIVIGIFAILGELFEVEVSTMFLIALLTVIGYSVNDTIVIFDRIRENILLHPNRTLAANANISISQSLGRSLNTSLTLLFTLLALLWFGGPTIRSFLWVLLIGVVVGTYSSIGIATNALVAWEAGDFRRLLRRIRPAPSSGP